jgi:outer membrane protein TolC
MNQDYLLRTALIGLSLLAMASTTGCRARQSKYQPVSQSFEHSAAIVLPEPYDAIGESLPQPDCVARNIQPASFQSSPLQLDANELPDLVSISLADALVKGLNETPVLRSLGAQLLSNPNSATASFDPLIRYADPVFGEQAALAAFDATVSASLDHANNDNVFNNTILGGGANEVVQDLTTFQTGWQKTATNGTSYALRSQVVYDNNNNPSSLFPSSYAAFWEAQLRRPLLQGSGIQFNQIAGPNARPGFLNTTGLVVAQINTNTSVADFELGVRTYVDQVINAYWNLYLAYQNLEAAKLVRDTSKDIWQSVKSKYENDLQGGEADKEAQAHEQYLQFEQDYIVALHGDPRNNSHGVIQAEADLRRLLGMEPALDVLLKPSDEPSEVASLFDWEAIVATALQRRIELRRQTWQIKRRELELLAAKNFLLPRLDAIATYRNNGFGDDLTGGGFRFSSAVSDMSTGDHNEWELGLQMNMPVGFRQANAGVQHAELRLRRERAILDEQEKQVLHDIRTAFRQSQQSVRNLAIARHRLDAATQALLARLSSYAADAAPLDQLLEAQRRLAEAQTNFQRSRIDMELATVDIHRESGQLLPQNAVYLNRNVRN